MLLYVHDEKIISTYIKNNKFFTICFELNWIEKYIDWILCVDYITILEN